MKIITRFGEVFRVEKVSTMNVSTTQFPRMVNCFICPNEKGWGYRQIPQEDVERIQLENGDWFRKEK